MDAPLVGFAGSALAERFRYWRGASGRRYLFSVFPLAGPEPCPAFEGGVIMAVRQEPDGQRRLLAVRDSGERPEIELARMREIASEASEIHVHLLASTAAERLAIAEDLMGHSIDGAQA